MKKLLLVIAIAVAAVVAAGALIWQPWALAPSTAKDSSRESARGPEWSATASFPTKPGLRARVEKVDPDGTQSSAFPAATTLRAMADFTLDGAQFPAGGAQVSFTLDEALVAEAVPVIAHWNEDSETWEPVETALSEDRRTAIASVSHFSKYGFFDYLFNAIGQVTGNAATSGVTCEQPLPDWADPQYFDDINSPVLWCGGKDANNADLLVAKVKMNRDTAAKVTLAIDHAWAWSDLWKSSPTDLATMAAAAELPSNPFSKRQYLIQPFGEMDFGFSRSALEDLYYGGSNQPLIQVETGWFYTAAAIMWDLIGDMAEGDSPIAAVSSTMAMLDCGQALLTAGSGGGAVDAFGKAMTCLGTQQSKDLLHRGVRTVLSDRYPHLTGGWITVHSKKILSKFGLIGLGMKTADFSLKIFSAVGDSTLPDEVRQFSFTPSLKAIKEAAAKKKSTATDKTYSGAAADITFDFNYPASWSVTGSNGNLTVSNAAGEQMATLGVLQVWGAESLPLSAPVEAEVNYGNFMIQQPATPCASCTTHVNTVIADSRKATTAPGFSLPSGGFGWPQPVLVDTGLSSAAQVPLKVVDLITRVGLAIVQSGTKAGNGYSQRVLIFEGQTYFATVDEAKSWMGSAEHRDVEEMIASIRVP